MPRQLVWCLPALLTACGATSTGSADAGTPPSDLNMQASDFGCITQWPKAGAFRITNKRGLLDQALAVASSPTGGTYPVGTVIQLVPNEAMVKHVHGWNQATSDWEFFALNPKSDGTTEIQQRGGAEVMNHFGGGSCYGCHSKAAPQWDLICGTDHGCAPLPFDDATIQQLQDADPRCQ